MVVVKGAVVIVSRVPLEGEPFLDDGVGEGAAEMEEGLTLTESFMPPLMQCTGTPQMSSCFFERNGCGTTTVCTN